MLSFTSSLNQNSEAFAIFINDKYDYKDKRNVLTDNAVKKIKLKPEFSWLLNKKILNMIKLHN